MAQRFADVNRSVQVANMPGLVPVDFITDSELLVANDEGVKLWDVTAGQQLKALAVPSATHRSWPWPIWSTPMETES